MAVGRLVDSNDIAVVIDVTKLGLRRLRKRKVDGLITVRQSQAAQVGSEAVLVAGAIHITARDVAVFVDPVEECTLHP
jgi:hypothetical protein